MLFLMSHVSFENESQFLFVIRNLYHTMLVKNSRLDTCIVHQRSHSYLSIKFDIRGTISNDFCPSAIFMKIQKILFFVGSFSNWKNSQVYPICMDLRKSQSHSSLIPFYSHISRNMQLQDAWVNKLLK